MSKDVNSYRGYYQPGQNMYYSSNSDGSKSRSYTRDALPGSVNPTFTKDVDMRQLNYAATNYAMNSYNSAWSLANQAPINTFSSYSTSSSNVGRATSLLGERHYNYGRSGGIQGPVSTSKVARSSYADSFVTHNINNQDPMPTLQQQTMERHTVDSVNPMLIYNYNTQKSIPDPKISSGQSYWQNKEKNVSIRVVPAAERKGRPQNPDDMRFVLFPKEPTFKVKIIRGVRIAKKVTKISYRQSLKNTMVYTIGRNGGSCKKVLAEGKRKRALWWIAQGRTIEEALLLCLRPYHEIYEEILEKNHSWGTQMMIRNLLVQINKEGMYNPFIGRPEASYSETSDDSADEATEQHIKTEDEPNKCYPPTNDKLDMNVQQNFGNNSNNLILCSLPTQDNMQNPTMQDNMPTQQEIGTSSIQNASYDPKSQFLSSLADCNRQPGNSKPESKLTHKDNPYTKVNTKTKTIKPKKFIKGASLRRYYYWLNVGKTPEEALALCVVKADKIPEYHQIKHTVGTLKNFVKTNRNQVKFHGTFPTSIVAKPGYCNNTNDFTENMSVENHQEESESITAENTEGSAHGLKNSNTSMTQVYLKEIEQFIKSLKCGSMKYKKIFEPEAIDKYRWWRHVGRTVNEAQKMCLYPFFCYPKEHEEGEKIIDFRTYILKNAANFNIADNCPPEIRGHAKLRYNFWIKLGKTPKEAQDLTLQGFMLKRKERQYKEYLSNLWSSGHTNPSLTQSSQNKNHCFSSSVPLIPTIQIQPTIEDFAKDDYDVMGTNTGDYKTDIHTYTQKTEDNAKQQVEKSTQLTNAELIRFEWWKKQGKSEDEARNLCHKSMAVSEALNLISSNKKEGDIASNTYERSKSNIPDLNQNQRPEEISNQQIFGKNAIKTDAMAETNFPQNIEAQEGHNLPITQNFEVPSNVKGSKQGEFRVCIKVNKVNIDFDNLNAIKNSLNLCIAGEDGIKIKNINRRSNRVIITCLNEQTRDWLDKQIPTLVPWENAQLEIIDEDEVPIDILARFFIPFDTEAECSSVTREQFMQHLHEQNPDVGCDRWIVHTVETKTDPIGVYVLGCIDKKSKDVLTSKDNKLKWSNKRNVKVKLSSRNNKSKAESAPRAVLFVPKVPECRLHSSQQYLLNRLHKLNPTVGCDRWTIVKKRIMADGAALLVRFNNASKHIVENIKEIRWYRSQNIVITIVPIYININFPIENESSYLRIIPQNQITKTLINKLHFFNPSFGCLKWVVVQLEDKDDGWHLTFKINEQCHQTLINSDYKLYWYGGRWLEIELGAVPELEMFESKKDTKHSKKPATSYQPKENVTKQNLNQIASGSMPSPQLMVNEESKVQDASNRGLSPSMVCYNPENRPDIAMLSSSRQDRTADVSDTEREPYHYERHYRVGSDYNKTHQLSPAPLEYAMPEIPEYAKPSDGHGPEYLRLVEFGEKEDMAQEHFPRGIRRYDDEDRDTGLEDRYRLESNRDAYYPNTEQRNVENVDYDNDFNLYYNNENRQEEEESRHLPHQSPDNIANPDPRSRDEYMHQDIDGYHFDQHLHDRVNTREIDYVREEIKFDRGERHFDREGDFDIGDRYFDREENYLNREERHFNTKDRYYGRGGINFKRGQRHFDRLDKSPQDGDRLHLEHVRSCQKTEYFQREWSPEHQNRNEYSDGRKRSHPRDDQWGQNFPHLHREALQDSRESLHQNKRARLSEDRRHDTLRDGFERLSVYHDRGHHYQESSSYSNHKRRNSKPGFDEPPSKQKRQRR